MAPISELSSSLVPLSLSRKLTAYLSSLGPSAASDQVSLGDASPLSTSKLSSRGVNLVRRETPVYNPGAGSVPGNDFNNNFIFIIFGILGASFIITGVWFFFRAPNGGFHWKENDWEDYKSTVLRRKGPNGTTLSGATESTDLGGGSVYKDYDQNDVQSSLGSEMSYLKRKFKGKKSSKLTGDKRSKNGKEKRAKLRGGDANHNIDLEANTAYEGGYVPSNLGTTVDDDMRAYRHEKPARVGGLNKAPESTQWDGSTAPGTDAHSDLLSNQEPTPTKKEKKREYTGGIRKVSSSASTFWGSKKKVKITDGEGNAKTKRRESKLAPDSIPEMSEVSGPSSNANSQHIQEEAKRLQELGRAAKYGGRPTRDFSFQYGDDATGSQVSASDVESSISAQARREARRRERREAGGRSSRSPEKRKSQSPSKKASGTGGYKYEYGSVMSDEDHDGDLGTKSYHHPIPGLSEYLSASNVSASPVASEVSAPGSDYAGERRKKRAEGRGAGGGGSGYRRG